MRLSPDNIKAAKTTAHDLLNEGAQALLFDLRADDNRKYRDLELYIQCLQFNL